MTLETRGNKSSIKIKALLLAQYSDPGKFNQTHFDGKITDAYA